MATASLVAMAKLFTGGDVFQLISIELKLWRILENLFYITKADGKSKVEEAKAWVQQLLL